MNISDFDRLPVVIQKMLTQYFPAETLGKTQEISKLFQKLVDRPEVWKQAADKLQFRVNPSNPKQAFIDLLPINKLILDTLPPQVAEPIRKQNPFAQRAAIEKLIHDIDSDEPSETLNSLRELIKTLSYKISEAHKPWRSKEPVLSYEKGALILLYRSGVLEERFEDWLSHLKDTDILDAYIEGVKEQLYTTNLSMNLLKWAIKQDDPKYVKAVMEMGYINIAPYECMTDAIVKIALAGNERAKVVAAMEPIFKFYQTKPKTAGILQEAQKLADTLVAKDPNIFHSNHHLRQLSIINVGHKVGLFFVGSGIDNYRWGNDPDD